MLGVTVGRWDGALADEPEMLYALSDVSRHLAVLLVRRQALPRRAPT
jgi:hypothetical protein